MDKKRINKQKTLNSYQKEAMGFCMQSSRNHLYMLSGLTAEVGEVNDKIAKWIRRGKLKSSANKFLFDPLVIEKEQNIMKQELSKEIGDVLWFVAGLAEIFNFSLGAVAEENINKLYYRKIRGTIDGDGDNR